MNFRVDLILESEQRSASVLNIKTIVRITSIVVPAIILLVVSLVWLGAIQVESRRATLVREWEGENGADGKQKRQQEALALKGDLAGKKKILTELDGWLNSNVEWAELLIDIQACVPEKKIQFTSLQMEQVLGTFLDKGKDDTPTRKFSMNLTGKVLMESPDDPGRHLNDFVEKLKGTPSYGKLFERVDAQIMGTPEVTDPGAATEANSLLFRVDFVFNKRKMQ